MKVGDLVALSSAGKKIKSNWRWKDAGGYGLIVYKSFHLNHCYRVLLFDKKGVHWDTKYFYRYEIKKFKKFE